MINKKRIRRLNDHTYKSGAILYWIGREHRVQDNWSLLAAQASAEANNVPLIVAFVLAPTFLGATRRQYGFMLKGLREIEASLADLNIPFILRLGDPPQKITEIVDEFNIGSLVTDFFPLRIKMQWNTKVAAAINMPMFEVDAHNIVPAWEASQKHEVGAYTIRPKIGRLREQYMEEFPVLHRQSLDISFKISATDWAAAEASLQVDETVPEIEWLTPGESAARAALKTFVDHGLHGYDENRNIPALNAQSELSPYLHFGHIAPQRVAQEVFKSDALSADKDAYLEELIVRRELSDNHCLYEPNYDTLAGAPAWAQQSLQTHEQDPREFLYNLEQLDTAVTHDPLWNAAQREMVTRGKMHGYMRMYWAKKILEWTPSPAEALKAATYLNDRYFVDGRDPNGYVGLLWAIAGLHDRPWFERPVFGKIRYMNFNGAKRKFDIDAYIKFVDTYSNG